MSGPCSDVRTATNASMPAVDHVRVDQRDVILDNALGFELSQALENRGRREPDGLGKLGLSGSGVVLKNIQN